MNSPAKMSVEMQSLSEKDALLSRITKSDFQTQVKKDHYLKTDYDGLESFINYYYQTKSILQFRNEVKKILEVGIGNKTLTNYLRQFGFNVTTCDFAADLQPDKVADVRNLPFDDNEFDATVAFEILEHIPFSDFNLGLKELARVSRKYVIISIPNSTSFFEFKIRLSLPKFREKNIYKKFQVRNYLTKQAPSSHKWEMNKKNYSAKKIKRVIKSCNLEILDEMEPEWENHHFFIMKKTPLQL